MDKLAYKVNHDKFPSGSKAINVLRDVPLLSVSSDGNIMIKNNANVPLYINGRIASTDIIRLLSADLIKTVEVITNPSSAYNATGSSGFVNIVLLKPKQSQYKGSIGIVNGLNRKLFFPGVNFSVNSKKIFFTLNSSIQSSLQNFKFDTKRLNKTNELVYSNEGGGQANISTNAVNASIFYDLDSSSEISGQMSFSSNKTLTDIVSNDKFSNQSFSINSQSTFNDKSNFLSFDFEYKKQLSKFSGFLFNYKNLFINPISIRNLSTIKNGNSQIINQVANSDSVQNIQHAFQTSYYLSYPKKRLYSEIGLSYSFEDITDRFNTLQYDINTNHFIKDSSNSDIIFLKQNQFAAFLITKFNIAV